MKIQGKCRIFSAEIFIFEPSCCVSINRPKGTSKAKYCTMTRKIGLLAAILFLFGLSAQAQLRDKATFFGGFNYQIVGMTPQGQPSPWRFPFYGMGVGMDYVLLHSNDQFSLGVNPNAHFSFIFSSAFGTSLLAQAPVFALARVGSGATPYNEQKVGVGAGIGLNYTYMRHSTSVVDQNNNLYLLRINEGFLAPSAVVEFAIRSRVSDYLFRFNWTLMRPTLEVEGFNNIPFRFGTGGLSIMYTF